METRFDIRLIIAGGRDFKDYDKLCEVMKTFVEEHPGQDIVVIIGTAAGADRLGERWAHDNDIPVMRYPADWQRYGKSAGFIRNRDMVSNGTHLIAFWDGQSKGTKHMIDLATEMLPDVHVVGYDHGK